jgi:hypothetical protein
LRQLHSDWQGKLRTKEAEEEEEEGEEEKFVFVVRILDLELSRIMKSSCFSSRVWLSRGVNRQLCFATATQRLTRQEEEEEVTRTAGGGGRWGIAEAKAGKNYLQP